MTVEVLEKAKKLASTISQLADQKMKIKSVIDRILNHQTNNIYVFNNQITVNHTDLVWFLKIQFQKLQEEIEAVERKFNEL